MKRRHILMASSTLGIATASASAPSAAAGTRWPANHPDLALKLIITGRRKPGTTLSEHRHHIRQVHGEWVRRFIAEDPATAPRRYAQNAVFDGCYRALGAEIDPLALNRDFVTEIWFPNPAALAASLQAPFYNAHLKADEDNFVDQANVVFMPTRERETLRRDATAPKGAFKLFCLHEPRPDARAAFSQAWATAPDALRALPAAASVIRHVQNDVLPGPDGAPARMAGIDEFWLDSEAAGQALLVQWRDWFAQTMERPGLTAPGSAVLLLAREDVLHEGPL